MWQGAALERRRGELGREMEVAGEVRSEAKIEGVALL
jgi:hypothetical protein